MNFLIFYFVIILDIPNAVYNWTLINGTFNKNTRVENDILILEPFTFENAGVYRCVAYSLELNMFVSKRININSDSNPNSNNVNNRPKKTIDVSDRIVIQLQSTSKEFRKGGKIRLKCHIGNY